MSIKSKMDKLNRIITSQTSTKHFIENMKPLEIYFTESDDNNVDQCFYPNEPNFQIPNVFLRTKTSSEIKKFIKSNNGKSDFSSSIDQILDDLESFDLIEEREEQDKERIEDEILNLLINNRKGGV
ncbi:hypothetical protein NGRA_0620 [Nosema granulosis]|uniref:Uncharacterized protein n=1 Tax=Nosema granulosis TaxID=83296 RepID=A0A9P6KZV7_9MICR|nr:hypothetical protein NGRA_0620 [Nosema granulosis]